MTIQRPTSGRTGDMTVPPSAWPEMDEDSLQARSELLSKLSSDVKNVLDDWRRQRTSIFDGHAWSGDASNAARAKFDGQIQQVEALHDQLAAAVRFYDESYHTVVDAKTEIIGMSFHAQDQIDDLMHSDTDDVAGQQAQVEAVVSKAFLRNAGVVTWHAGAATVDTPGAVVPEVPGAMNAPGSSSEVTRPGKAQRVSDDNPVRDEGLVGAPANTAPTSSTPAPPRTAPGSSTPFISPIFNAIPPSTSAASQSPSDDSQRSQNITTASPSALADQQRAFLDGAASGMEHPASSIQPTTSIAAQPSPPVGAAAAVAPPPAPGGSPVSGQKSGGAGSVSPATSSPTPSMPMFPIAPVTGIPSALVRINPTARSSNSRGVAAAPVPVSPARLERDSIVASATGSAGRRRGGDPLTRARRIAAALNVGILDFGFVWVTGLTTDGTIVVANSYGLGYIPATVKLPEYVRMATADESIPVVERAKWATHPMLALQGWARAHELTLRAVIATEAQFANTDPGAAKIILRPDDIPASGQMLGRSRVEVVAPEAAARLASVADADLIELLPPAPVDANPPAEHSARMWFDLAMPLMTTATDRGATHIGLFIEYAEHSQQLALHRAHAASDGQTQREAIADWMYWQHLSVLMSDALGADVSA